MIERMKKAFYMGVQCVYIYSPTCVLYVDQIDRYCTFNSKSKIIYGWVDGPL